MPPSPPLAPIIVVTGPTGGGKMALAVEIAETLAVPIVSVDSMKVYRGMDIGTAKPTPEKLRGVPCHLVDLREAWEEFSVGDYLAAFQDCAAGLPRPLILCGGTAFYLHALLEGIFSGAPADPEVRVTLEAEVEERGLEPLHQRLRDLDPVAAEKIHRHDRRRIIRALEVMELAGGRLSERWTEREPLLARENVRMVGIGQRREDLYRRIDGRVERMFDQGWVDEVSGLRRAHDPPWSRSAEQSIGYPLIAEALDAGQDPRETCAAIQQRTRRFARAQLTWFRKMPIEWWPADATAAVPAQVERWLESFERGDGLGEIDPDRRTYEGL